MKSALEVIQASGLPEAFYKGKTPRQLRNLAKELDGEWKAPPEATVEIVAYEPKGKGQPGMFLSISADGSRNGIFARLCDGKELTDAGRAKAVELLTSVSNQAADLVSEL